MKIFRILLVSVACIVLTAGLGYETVSAGNAHSWSPDEKVPGYLDDTFTPFLLADKNKTVHAFASQWVENNGRRLAIVYRQWTLVGGWTRPVDIILSPTSGDANFLGAYLDSSDRMHVIFTATEAHKTGVYYTNAPAINADWAPAWSAPMLVGDDALNLNSAAITGDNQGNLVIIYSGNHDGNGVYYVHSKDSGATWSSPLPMFLTYDTNLNTYSLRLTVGPEEKIRAAWTVVTNLGVDEALYFANFDSQNSKWDTSVELDKRIDLPDYFGPSFPAIVDNGQEIIVVYNNGNPLRGRPVDSGRPIQQARISANSGLTWTEPMAPFPFHVGRSGEHTLTLDGNGDAHTLFVQRIEKMDEDGKRSIISGVWHSVYQNGVWSNPDRIVTLIAPHDVRAVVSQGNVILVVWREDPGEGKSGIWYSYNVLDEAELPVIPLATAALDYSVQTIPTPLIATLIIPELTTRPELPDEAPPSNLRSSPVLPIIIGILPIALILIGVILGYGFLAKRRK